MTDDPSTEGEGGYSRRRVPKGSGRGRGDGASKRVGRAESPRAGRKASVHIHRTHLFFGHFGQVELLRVQVLVVRALHVEQTLPEWEGGCGDRRVKERVGVGVTEGVGWEMERAQRPKGGAWKRTWIGAEIDRELDRKGPWLHHHHR